MHEVLYILLIVVRIYRDLLVARIIIEMIQSFSRSFRPPRWFYVIAEPLFLVTDPPVKVLRKVIPPLPAGGVMLDISILVLFFLIFAIEQGIIVAYRLV